MKAKVSAHRVRGYGGTVRTAQRLTEEAMRLVARSVSGRMPDVEVILTDPRGLAELATAADAELAGVLDSRTRTRVEKGARRALRDISACSIPRRDGRVLVLVNVDRHPTPALLAVTLVHQLVHAMQVSRPKVVDKVIASERDRFRVERMSSRARREFDRQLDEHEREAYSREHLADHLVPGASSRTA
ncbi:hypothetical protein [Streptomyces sp. NPDC008150]|uniref:hypothetical protein n=1 Tax=Streptomyces sp. NPDC008150 TaxID=3364816 RepID=UPI0036EFEF6A